MKSLRPIAIYLPQFYPTPENDAWWGKGFTEWRNVVKARPRFRGHYQPHLPADLGYYDLRVPETREAQASLAASYGIHGFCYYHYWFNGRRILDRPVREILESGKPDFPFMLAWANENWTRIWNGSDTDVLLEQVYSDQDHHAHATALISYFKDPRYIRINDRPVFAVYRFAGIPDPGRMIAIFRDVARGHGIDLYICWFDRDFRKSAAHMRAAPMDALIEFQPFSTPPDPVNAALQPGSRLKRRWRRRWRQVVRSDLVQRLLGLLQPSQCIFHDMEKTVADDLNRLPDSDKRFPGVAPAWDNSSRRANGEARLFLNSSPALFRTWVAAKVRAFNPPSPDENLLFVNAWNEWAEGNHLEPCERYGHAWLEALREGLASGSETDAATSPKPASPKPPRP